MLYARHIPQLDRAIIIIIIEPSMARSITCSIIIKGTPSTLEASLVSPAAPSPPQQAVTTSRDDAP